MKLPVLLTKVKKSLGEAQKALAAVAGVVAQGIELGVLHGTALHYAQLLSGAVAACLVYLAPYTKATVVKTVPAPPAS